jgi:hypothetical protein
MNVRTLVAVTLASAALPLLAAGQAYFPPYYGTTPAMFQPQIDTIESGVNYNVQATVSHDRKYVTLTMQPQLSHVVSLQTFSFQTGGTGFVGAPAPVVNPVARPALPPPPGGAGRVKVIDRPVVAAVQPAVAPRAAVLEQEGMVRLAAP